MMCWKRAPFPYGTGRGSYAMYFLFQALVFLTFLVVGRVQACDLIVKWGANGSGDGWFNNPYGVAVDSSGNVYVADTDNHRIQKFNSSGTYLTQWGSYGYGDGQFDSPYGVAVDSSGNVYVADAYNHRIQKFNSSGTYLTQWGSYGSGDGQFNFPEGVAVDSSGNVYVADTFNSRIQKLNSSGTYLTKWGSYGTGDGLFNTPYGVAVDSSGNVYVADTINARIQKFNSSGTYLTKWGSGGSGDGQFDHPYGVAVDSSGNVYVADTFNSRIQKFNSSGAFLTKCGSYGTGDGLFSNPQGVAAGSSGNVYVADAENHRIQEIDTGTSASAWTTVGSTGTVDDADVSLAVFSGPTVTVSSAVSTATLDLRYNLVEDGLLKALDAVYLKVCYRDNGGSAQVIVKLWALNFSTGTASTLMTFDSNAFTASGSFQSKSISNCPGGGITFDFLSKAYYLEVALKKFSSAGAPALSGIAVGYTHCPYP